MTAKATKTDQLATERQLAAIEWAQGSIAHLAPGRALADEIVADRRSPTDRLARPGAQEPGQALERLPD